MPYSLKARAVLVVGGSRGLGATIAVKFAREGADVAITYLGNRARADETAKECEAHGAKTLVLQADGGKAADLERVVRETKDGLGRLDVIIGNQGYTEFTKFEDLNAMTEDQWNRMALLRAAKPVFDSNEDGGVLITTGSIAGTKQGGSSMAYSVTKAAQIHLVKCLASTQGPKCRVNSVLPGLMLTEWATNGFSKEEQDQLHAGAALKAATDVEDVADAFLMIAKNSSMTGQMVTVGPVGDSPGDPWVPV